MATIPHASSNDASLAVAVAGAPSSALSALDRAPMIPAVCASHDFLFGTDAQQAEHARNPALVASLVCSLKAWLSHLGDVAALSTDFHAALDAGAAKGRLDAAAVLPPLRRLEAECAFGAHFERHETAAVRAVLAKVPLSAPSGPSVKEMLADLDARLAAVRWLHGGVARSLEALAAVAALCAPSDAGDVWAVADIADVLPPLFSALRALFVCAPSLGFERPRVFVAIVRGVVDRVARSVRAACGSLYAELAAAPSKAAALKRRAVHAQEACVAVQEAFHALRLALVDAAFLTPAAPPPDPAATAALVAFFSPATPVGDTDSGASEAASEGGAAAVARRAIVDVDDAALFAVAEWQYARLDAVLALLDGLAADRRKIGSALTDGVERAGDLFDPACALSTAALAAEAARITATDAPNPHAVLERMGLKAAAAAAAAGDGVRSPNNAGAAGRNAQRGGDAWAAGHASPFSAAAVREAVAAAAIAAAGGGGGVKAPRLPFHKLTDHLAVNVEFNPPVVTLLGGPVSAMTIEGLQSALPLCCTNKSVVSSRPTLVRPTFVETRPLVSVLEIPAQSCDPDVGQAHFLLALLDTLEADDAWNMLDCISWNEGAKFRHTYLFQKARGGNRNTDDDGEKRQAGATPLAVGAPSDEPGAAVGPMAGSSPQATLSDGAGVAAAPV